MAKRAPAKRRPRRDMRQIAFTRFMLIVALLIIWFGGVGARLVYLQVSEHDWLRERALRQRTDVKKTRMLRGSIFDRSENVLSMSIKSKTLYADATEIENTDAAARSIAKALGTKPGPLAAQLRDAKETERKFVPLAKELDDETVLKLNRLLEDPAVRKADLPKFEGLHWREDQKRSYPQGTLAAHVIGFSNAEGVGQAGIEQSQNEVLYGAVIKRVQERDRLGRVYDERVSEQSEPGDVVLTLSSSIQYKAETALRDAVESSGARAGMAIVLDHKTGEVLAMANYPTFDPNELKGISESNLRNNAVQSFYSPGSVFKLITYGAALERGLITPEAEIDTGNGVIEVARHRFSDHGTVGRITYAKALAISSNVSAVKTGLRVGKEAFYETVRNFGFGSPTGIDLPAETAGMVRPPDKWFGDSLASMSIGYEIGVSPLQMATAFATIANNGIRVQPHIIKETRRSDETAITVANPESKRVMSVEAAAGLRRMLRQVVVAGTGKKAQVAGYTTAGKTGTAWKYDPAIKRVSASKYVSSFMGFAPAGDPKITIAVMIDEPRIGGRNGGDVAAPVFRSIAEQVLPELKVAPDADGAELPADDEAVEESVGAGEIAGTASPAVSEEGVVAKAQPKPASAATPKKETKERPKQAVKAPPAKVQTTGGTNQKDKNSKKEKPKDKT